MGFILENLDHCVLLVELLGSIIVGVKDGLGGLNGDLCCHFKIDSKFVSERFNLLKVQLLINN